MTPERLTDTVTLYCADCLDVLPTLEPGSVDAVITDPPYGIRLASNGTVFRSMRAIAGDEDCEIGQAVLDVCDDIGWPALAFCDPLKPWRGDWRQSLAWDKGEAVGIGGDRRTCFKRSWEMILASRRFGPIGGDRDSSVLHFPVVPGIAGKALGNEHGKTHPAEKSRALMQYLTRKFTRDGQTILDPFAGSGTTGIAAMLEGRRCILIEKDPAYCEVIRRRVRECDQTAPGTLFAHLPDLFTEAQPHA
jgi:DNA modification methylase